MDLKLQISDENLIGCVVLWESEMVGEQGMLLEIIKWQHEFHMGLLSLVPVIHAMEGRWLVNIGAKIYVLQGHTGLILKL